MLLQASSTVFSQANGQQRLSEHHFPKESSFFVISHYIKKGINKEKKYETPFFKVWGVKPESGDPYLIVQK